MMGGAVGPWHQAFSNSFTLSFVDCDAKFHHCCCCCSRDCVLFSNSSTYQSFSFVYMFSILYQSYDHPLLQEQWVKERWTKASLLRP